MLWNKRKSFINTFNLINIHWNSLERSNFENFVQLSVFTISKLTWKNDRNWWKKSPKCHFFHFCAELSSANFDVKNSSTSKFVRSFFLLETLEAVPESLRALSSIILLNTSTLYLGPLSVLRITCTSWWDKGECVISSSSRPTKCP